MFFSVLDINNYYKKYAEMIDNNTIYSFLQNNPLLYDGKDKKT